MRRALAAACFTLLVPASEAAQSGATTDSKAKETAPARSILARLELPTARGGEAKPMALLACDLDGDGKDELVATTRGPGGVQVWSGLTNALRAAPEPRVFAVGDYPLGPIFLGAAPRSAKDPALIVVAPRASKPEDGVVPEIDVLDARKLARGDADPVVRKIPLERRARAIACGDLLKDGTIEIAVVTLDDELLVFGKDATPIVRVPLGDALATTMLVLADGSGIAIGFQESRRVVLWNASKDATGKLALSRGPEAGLFERARTPSAPDGLPRDLLELDTDGDGDTELAVAGGDESVWIFGRGAKGGVAAALASTPEHFTTSSIPIDLEARTLADGEHELCALGLLGLSYSRYRIASDGVVGAIGDAYAGQSPVDAAYGDFDGDGKVDLAIANGDAGRVSVVFGDASGGFTDARYAKTERTPHSLAVGDLDGDGFPEVLVLNAVDGTLSIAKNDKGVLLDSRRQALAKSADALRAADLDGDGKLEAAFLAQRGDESRLTILFGEKGELFERAAFPPIELGGKGGDLLLADFDGDGKVDVLASAPLANTITMLPNATGASHELAFGPAVATEVASGPRALARLDAPSELAVALGGPGPRTGVAILRLERSPTGELGWIEIDSIDTGLLPLSMASSDLDGDGVRDLALLIAEKNADSQCFVLPCLRQTNGGWKALERIPVGYRPYKIASGDLDGDGRAEIVVSAQNSHHVELWRALAGTTPDERVRFERCPDLGVHAGCLDVVLADLDQDGRPEVIVADGFSSDVAVVKLR